MKKILTVLLLLSSFLLVGCEKFQKDKIGGPNTSYENLEIKKIFTKGVIDFFKPETKLTITTLEENAWLEYSNSRIMVFSNNKVYSLETNKYFDIDQAGLSHVIYSYQYILANYETKYLVYHYLTGDLLYNIPRNQNDDYLFNEDYISVRGLNQSGDYVEKERYEFRDYKSLVQDGLEKEDPLKVERKIKVKDYSYSFGVSGVSIYKDNKFYSYYAYDSGFKDYFVLESGNILTSHQIQVDFLSDDYDYLVNGAKYKMYYYLYDVKEKKAIRKNIPIIIEMVVRKQENFPCEVDAMITFKTIDPLTKTVSQNFRLGSIDNKLNIREVNLGVGEIYDFYPINENLFVIQAGVNDLFLIDGNNNILNTFIYNKQDYTHIIFDNETIMLVSKDFLQHVFIYNLRTSELLHEGYRYINRVKNQVILKKDDNYYAYNGDFTQLEEPYSYLSGGAPVYIKKNGALYDYYHEDGTFLFSSNSMYAYYQLERTTGLKIHIYSYEINGVIKHCIVKEAENYFMIEGLPID